jgi:hypothetical protein
MTRKAPYLAAIVAFAVATFAQTAAPAPQGAAKSTPKKQAAPAKAGTSAPAKRAASAPAKTGAAASKTGAVPKTGATKTGTAPRTATAPRPATKTGTRTAASRTARKTAVPRTTWRNRQTTPTPERYKEIQNALVAKGYLQREHAVGVWGESSTDALKRFQADQNLEATGKINSLSLIALGLGPKHDAAVVAKPAGQ